MNGAVESVHTLCGTILDHYSITIIHYHGVEYFILDSMQ